jgi:hypothetical protein
MAAVGAKPINSPAGVFAFPVVGAWVT